MEIEVPYIKELRQQLDDKLFKRKLFLWYYYVKGLSQKEITEETEVATSTISDIIKKWNDTGLIEDLPRSGRKKEITKRQEKKIKEIQLKDRAKSAAAIYKEMNVLGNEVSYYQTLRTINAEFMSVYAPYKIKLTPKNKEKRVKWCENALEWRDWKWKSIIWTDEKIFRIEPQHQKLRVKILFDEDPTQFSLPLKQQGGKGLMFFGAISLKGKFFFETIEGKVDSKVFADFLKDLVLPAFNKSHGLAFKFHLDNAPVHKGETRAFLEQSHIETLKCPTQSPDLNPVEQVWLWMAQKLKGLLFHNLEDLKSTVFRLWGEIPDNVIFSYINEIKTKILWVKEHNGELCPDHI